MLKTSVIPCLLLRNQGLVKTVKFKEPKYFGDPINIVKLFNDKEVDELLFLDITASVENARPPIDLLSKIASECFMPLDMAEESEICRTSRKSSASGSKR